MAGSRKSPRDAAWGQWCLVPWTLFVWAHRHIL